jgi:hypothetical protein
MSTASLERLESILATVPARLRALAPDEVRRKPDPARWSKKEELGHLIDSTFNNHQRVVRAQVEDAPALPGYDGDRWVRIHAYQERDWNELVDLWVAANRQLLAAAGAATSDSWERRCTIGASEPMTLGFALEDYVRHMVHHLQHIGMSEAH